MTFRSDWKLICGACCVGREVKSVHFHRHAPSACDLCGKPLPVDERGAYGAPLCETRAAAPPPFPFPRDRLEDRMNRDPMLRSVVDMLTHAILKLEMTPTEVREAAIYACMQAEMRRMPTRYSVPAATVQEARERLVAMQAHLDSYVEPPVPTKR